MIKEGVLTTFAFMTYIAQKRLTNNNRRQKLVHA